MTHSQSHCHKYDYIHVLWTVYASMSSTPLISQRLFHNAIRIKIDMGGSLTDITGQKRAWEGCDVWREESKLLEPVTPIECFDVKPMTPFGCYNLKPMTPYGCCNLKPMTYLECCILRILLVFYFFLQNEKVFQIFKCIVVIRTKIPFF